jgi:ABC-2 type transport system ATP-binding protein
VIQAEHLTKRYGERVAVDDLSFTIHPGQVTGFLGPNGAGKSTTMRMIVGLDRPDSGTVTVDGRQYADLTAPISHVGVLLDAKAIQPSRSAYNHLRAIAATHGIPASRVESVIDLVGLSEVAKKRVGGFSLGMGQRLGIAVALLGNPDVVILDEPVNGLDPEGVRWVRNLLRGLADEGRTVLLSSHLMSEMEVTADHLVIIGRGRIIKDVSMQELRRSSAVEKVRVRTPEVETLIRSLAGPGVSITSPERQTIEITGVTAEGIGQTALAEQIPLYELTPERPSLEDIFMNLTADAVEYHSQSTLEVAA